jgi:gas vesicle protein
MGEDPGVIRAEIEQTRQRVGDQVDALSYKTDVGARASDFVEDKKEAVKSKLSGAKETVIGPLPDRRAVKRGADYMRETAESNPLGLALGGLAVGFLVGTLLPQTRVENEQLGEFSDRMIDAAKDTASEAVERGKQVAQEAVGAAKQTAEESAQQQSGQMSDSLKESAREVASSTRDSQE